jgi:LacI family transcriptional regulator, galactose operon repressor
MVTLKDIADKLEISTAAVSMALSGKGRVSEEVRKKVYSTANELGYRFNRPFLYKTHKTAIMLLPVYNTWGHVWHFLKDIIETIQNMMTAEGYTSVILPITKNQPVQEIMELIFKAKASAVFSIHYGSRELFTALSTHDIPLVVINNSEYQRDFNSVCVDDFQGSYEAVKTLIELGHTAIACIDYPRPNLPVIFGDRFIGFKKAIDEEHLHFSDDWHITVPLDASNILIEQLKSVMADSNKPRPTAFFVHDDFQACRVYHILNAIGYRVPEDVSLIAPGDTMDYKQPETPAISTLKINTRLMGKYAVEMMLSRISQEEPKEHHVLKIKQQFFDRGSILSRN